MSAIATLRHRALGVAFIGVIVGLLALSVLFYLKAFTSTVDVTLVAGCQPPPAAAGTGPATGTGPGTQAAAYVAGAKMPICTTTASLQDQSAGHQLDIPADVKLRGIVVGSVRGASLVQHHAVLHLALMPSQVHSIPANVNAEIIPKTLFGEKYVDLVLPQDPSPQHIAKGDVIAQSTTSIEAEQVFNDVLPLLQTLQPALLNTTLTNIAEALQGRGNELGDNLVRTDSYLQGLNPDIANIQTDITGLEDLANNLHAATPDLLALARQASTTARTLVAKAPVFASFLTGTRAFADTATAVLTRNENGLVTLAKLSQPTLALLAEYSPEYTCLLQGLTDQDKASDGSRPTLQQAFSPHGADNQYGLHINVKLTSDQGAYTQADAPKNTAQNPTTVYPAQARSIGAPCYGLPAARTVPIAGSVPVNGTPVPGAPHSAPTSGGSPAGATPSSRMAESSSATALARILAAPQLGVAGQDVPDLATLLLAPALAGTTVSVEPAGRVTR